MTEKTEKNQFIDKDEIKAIIHALGTNIRVCSELITTLSDKDKTEYTKRIESNYKLIDKLKVIC